MSEGAVENETAVAQPGRGQMLTIGIIILAVAGLIVAVELTHIHYKVNTDPDFASFCNMGEAVNCESVAASSYSQLFGVPIAVWGIYGYLVLLGLAVAGTRRSKSGELLGFPGLIFLWSLAAMAGTATLAYISSTKIASFCILCVGLYVVNALVLVLASLLVWRAAGGVRPALTACVRRLFGHLGWTLGIGGVLTAVLVSLILFYPQFQMEAAPLEIAPEQDECLAGHHTDEGYPLFGAVDAKVSIIEFSDYQCGHCKIAHSLLRKLIHEEYEGKVRLVHRHFPLDQECNAMITRPFHKRACAASRASICADKQGKFWEYQDLVWANSRHLEKKHLLDYARKVELDIPTFEGCLIDPHVDQEIQQDLRDGRGWGVKGTPSFVINGKFIEGARPVEGFRKLIDEALQRCEGEPAAVPGAAAAPAK